MYVPANWPVSFHVSGPIRPERARPATMAPTVDPTAPIENAASILGPASRTDFRSTLRRIRATPALTAGPMMKS